jgi:hypothetical protein
VRRHIAALAKSSFGPSPGLDIKAKRKCSAAKAEQIKLALI